MSHPPWNSDCLSVIAVLVMSQEGKKLRKLARQHGLFEKGSDPDIAEVLQGLHEVCHRDTDFARALGKNLDNRFRATLIRVRSLEPEQVRKLDMTWPMPLLWATLTDDREEIRLHGRRLLHGLFWNALRRASLSNEDEEDLQGVVDLLQEKVKAQSAKTEGDDAGTGS